jgi:subtilisin-like proprotein convertase family protein
VNDAPTISDLPDQAVAAGTSTLPIEFFIGDAESSPDGLALSVNSSDPLLVPTNNIVLGRSGPAIALTITPAPGRTGVATITLSVSDGTNSVSTNFVLGVSALLLRTVSFTNAAPILINDSGPASPYPSVINVTGLAGTISNVVLTLRGLNHARTPDLDVALTAPSGSTVLVCADAGSGGVSNVTLSLSDGASGPLPLVPLVSGAFLLSDYAPTDFFPAPAPTNLYAASFSAVTGQNPNGLWSLYIVDDSGGEQGMMAGGWTLTLTTVAATLRWEGRNPQGQPVLRLEGLPSQQYAIEAAEEFGAWTQLGTVQPTNGAAVFTDTVPGLQNRRFYRARALP